MLKDVYKEGGFPPPKNGDLFKLVSLPAISGVSELLDELGQISGSAMDFLWKLEQNFVFLGSDQSPSHRCLHPYETQQGI